MLNPTTHQLWIDPEIRQPKIFEGFIMPSGNRRRISITELQKSFDLKKDYTHADPSLNSRHEVVLYFYPSGIRVQIIGSKE
jgi:hypothetical protein